MKTNAELPPSEVEKLRALRELEDPTELRARVLALCNARWPLRAIGDAIGVTRVGVRSWRLAAEESPEIVRRAGQLTDVPRLPLSARGSRVQARRVYPKVPEADVHRLRELQEQASKVRGWTPADAPERAAARELEELLDLYVNKRKVPAQHVARDMGISRRAVVARLERALEKAGAQ